MDTTGKNAALDEVLKNGAPLTPLELNSIKLDDKHTLLTPDYLENISSQKNDQA